MEINREEALRAKQVAEQRFAEKDFVGARNYALKAKTLYPELEGISQMVATFEVYMASEAKSNGEINYYYVLGLNTSADRDMVKKQYRKMAVLLHPDKNKTVGADGAFRLVSEAWTKLSDSLKRTPKSFKREKKSPPYAVDTTYSSTHNLMEASAHFNYSNLSTSHGLDSFWTVCTSCKVQYEYLRKYVNKKLKCKNCRGTFIAVETGAGPMNGSFPCCTWSYTSGHGYGSHGCDVAGYGPTTNNLCTANGVSGVYTGHGHAYNYVSTGSDQWGSHSGTSAGVSGPGGSYGLSDDAAYHANGKISATRPNGKRTMQHSLNTNVHVSFSESSSLKAGRPEKKRKVVFGASIRNVLEGNRFASPADLMSATTNYDGNSEHQPKPSGFSELATRRVSVAPTFDARKLLIDKARNDIKKKLEEMRLASAAYKKEKEKERSESTQKPKQADIKSFSRQPKTKKDGPVTINVPDPDFHDFDKDRLEECFKPKQIWGLYDEDDGMPRLYCIIRQVLSLEPFQIHITYLNSKSDSEFGSVNWIDSGFTKSCGNFRASHSDIVNQVNIFSHLLKGEKAGRGGCVRIYPKKGDIWAVYRNWSSHWDRSTPDEERHKYEMVEVLGNYSEELGVCVAPLTKLAGYKTVYQTNTNKDAVRWIPRREMLRFSHQVPSWPLDGEEASNLSEKCWDLDPAATPDELLYSVAQVKA